MVQINLTDDVPLFTYLTIEKEGFKRFPGVTLMTALDPIGLSPSTDSYIKQSMTSGYEVEAIPQSLVGFFIAHNMQHHRNCKQGS